MSDEREAVYPLERGADGGLRVATCLDFTSPNEALTPGDEPAVAPGWRADFAKAAAAAVPVALKAWSETYGWREHRGVPMQLLRLEAGEFAVLVIGGAILGVPVEAVRGVRPVPAGAFPFLPR